MIQEVTMGLALNGRGGQHGADRLRRRLPSGPRTYKENYE